MKGQEHVPIRPAGRDAEAIVKYRQRLTAPWQKWKSRFCLVPPEAELEAARIAAEGRGSITLRFRTVQAFTTDKGRMWTVPGGWEKERFDVV